MVHSINEKILKRSQESLDNKGSYIFHEDFINDLNFLYANLCAAINQKGAELQSLVPVADRDKEKGPLSLDFNNSEELQGDNERKIESGRFRKAFKR